MRHTYKAEQWLPLPVEVVFAFFANPANLPPLMPAWQKARIERATIVAPPTPPNHPASIAAANYAAGAGTRMTISFLPVPFSPIRVPWDAEITEFTWNEHFCDVQHRGPFAYWRHCHRLSATTRMRTNGLTAEGTLVRDEVEYELPVGWLGDVANRLAAGPQIKSIFEYRHRRTVELLSHLPLIS